MGDEPYTPTEDEVRHVYVHSIAGGLFGGGAFDRFLAQVRAEARREGAVEALREAATHKDLLLLHDRAVAASALREAADEAPPGLVSTMRVMDDGYPSAVVRTNAQAADMVRDWLRDRADRIEAEG
jgi:hypothetical protein